CDPSGLGGPESGVLARAPTRSLGCSAPRACAEPSRRRVARKGAASRRAAGHAPNSAKLRPSRSAIGSKHGELRCPAWPSGRRCELRVALEISDAYGVVTELLIVGVKLSLLLEEGLPFLFELLALRRGGGGGDAPSEMLDLGCDHALEGDRILRPHP